VLALLSGGKKEWGDSQGEFIEAGERRKGGTQKKKLSSAKGRHPKLKKKQIVAAAD